MGGMNVINQMHSIPQLRELAVNDRGFIVLACGDTVPSDTTAGYEVGCIFIDTNASAGSQLLINVGSATSCNFDPATGGQSLAGLNATVTELNAAADLSAQALATPAGVGITAGTGTIYKHALTYAGNLKKITIYIDLTGLGSSTTDLDVIGVAGGPAHLGRILAAEIGTVEAVQMSCLEAPAGGVTDIILYAADEGTAVFDDGIAALTADTALIDNAAGWAVTTQRGCTAVPAANQYLYLVNGAAGVPGTYTAGKFLIEVWGY